MTALVEAQFSHRFGRLQVIDDLKLAIREGEFVCVVGPSGCGKTTLGSVLCGLLRPTTGEVRLKGSVIDPARDNVSMVFQDASLWPWRNVEQNVRVGLEIKRMPRKEADRRVADLLSLVNLRGFEHQYPYQLSGGMKQRVSIARAFATHSDLVIMDEPFVALDAPTREAMQAETLRLWRDLNRSVVFVTHNLEEAIFLGQRIIVLSARPARVLQEFEVPWPHPRDVTSEECVHLRRQIRTLLL
ncbi:MAG: ABC transporter ATP-binding protein [Vulcanimicrobiaceae bacterium]